MTTTARDGSTPPWGRYCHSYVWMSVGVWLFLLAELLQAWKVTFWWKMFLNMSLEREYVFFWSLECSWSGVLHWTLQLEHVKDVSHQIWKQVLEKEHYFSTKRPSTVDDTMWIWYNILYMTKVSWRQPSKLHPLMKTIWCSWKPRKKPVNWTWVKSFFITSLQTEISQELLAGFPWIFWQIFMFPRG